MNGIISLSLAASAGDDVRDDQALSTCRLSNEVIKPFYSQRVQETIILAATYRKNACSIHKPEGQFPVAVVK